MNKHIIVLTLFLTGPPKSHAFVNLPLQSNFLHFIISALKRITLAGIISSLMSMIFVVSFKYVCYGGVDISPLNYILGLKLGTLSGITKHASIGFVAESFEHLCINYTLSNLLTVFGIKKKNYLWVGLVNQT